LSYFAAALARGRSGWTAEELDLDTVRDLGDVVDALCGVDPDADLWLLFVEFEDTSLVVLRADADDEPRVFASDPEVIDVSRLGAVLAGGLEPVEEIPVSMRRRPSAGGANDGLDADRGPGLDEGLESRGSGAGDISPLDPELEASVEAIAAASVAVAEPPDAGSAVGDDDGGFLTGSDDATAGVVATPLGDVDLLSDLGTPARRLVQLVAREGALPADVVTDVCRRAGCADALEELRDL